MLHKATSLTRMKLEHIDKKTGNEQDIWMKSCCRLNKALTEWSTADHEQLCKKKRHNISILFKRRNFHTSMNEEQLQIKLESDVWYRRKYWRGSLGKDEGYT